MYPKFYEKILFPFYESFLRRRKTLAYLRELKKSQWFPPEAIKKIQWRRLNKLLTYAYENVPYYREKLEAVGLHPRDINRYEDFQRIPLLTKDDIRNNQKKLLSREYRNKKNYKTRTSGSTGMPMELNLDHDTYEKRQAAVKRTYGWAGYCDGEKATFVWSDVGQDHFIKKVKHYFDEFLKNHRLYRTSNFNGKFLPRYISGINSFKPKFIVSYTSALYFLSQFIEAKNMKIWSPEAIIVAAEKLFTYQRILIKKVFKCPVFETYGCGEVMSIAGECEMHNGMHVNSEMIYLETLKNKQPAQPFEIGEIVVTDLNNYCMPLIRYRNEDIGTLSNEKCGCGRGLPLLQSIEGRVLDTVQTADGRVIVGETFTRLLKQFDEIHRYQVIQEDLENVQIRIVKLKEFSDRKLDYMKKEILKIMGVNIKIDLQFVKDIDLSKTGKFRVVVSKVPINFKNI